MLILQYNITSTPVFLSIIVGYNSIHQLLGRIKIRKMLHVQITRLPRWWPTTPNDKNTITQFANYHLFPWPPPFSSAMATSNKLHLASPHRCLRLVDCQCILSLYNASRNHHYIILSLQALCSIAATACHHLNAMPQQQLQHTSCSWKCLCDFNVRISWSKNH